MTMDPETTESSTTVLDPNSLSIPIENLTLSQTSSFDGWASHSVPLSPASSQEEDGEHGQGKSVTKAYTNALLDEFDPLADNSKEVEQAWAQVRGHPPPPPIPLKDTDGELVPDSKESEDAPADPDTPPPPPIPKDSPSNSSALTPLRQLSSVARRLTTSAQEQASALSNVPARLLSGSRSNSPRPSSPSSSPNANANSNTTPRKPQISQPTQDRQIPEAPVITQSPPSPANQASTSASSNPTMNGDTFDFQKFLDQLKVRSAEPVAKYLRSFLSNFAKKPFAVNDQIRIIQDFLDFIALRMRECDPWKHSSDADFENAMEAMEKLVMNRLYEFTFTPLVAKTSHPVTTDDLERDNILSQRIKLFKWIEEKHLDVPTGHEGFVNFAAQELLKINHYKAPRDKLICILNCCKVIYGLIRHAHMDESADAFVPILIYVVLKTNPQNMISNLEYINRFRNPAKLQSETGYYLSSLMGAVSFVETMDFNSLSNITKEEFDRCVEEAILELNNNTPSPHLTPSPSASTPTTNVFTNTAPPIANSPAQAQAHSGEESAHPLSLSTPDFDSLRPFAPPSTPNFKFPQPGVIAEDTKKFLQRTGDTIGNLKPFEALGKLFGDDRPNEEERHDQSKQTWTGLPGPFAPLSLRDQPPQIPQGDPNGGHDSERMGAYAPYVSRRMSPSPSLGDTSFDAPATPTRPPPSNRPIHLSSSQTHSRHPSRTPTPHLDIPSLSTSIASIDAATAQRSSASMSTLMQIFPNADRELVEMVLEGCEGDVGVTLERLLEMMGDG